MGKQCRICSAALPSETIKAREMMFGTREEFLYAECAACGCVQIVEIPADLSRHYPSAYYSFHPAGALRRWVKGAWLPDPLTPARLMLRLLSALPFLGVAPEWVRRAGVPRSARVLEVGCGAGERLMSLKSLGFHHLVGVDPFLPADTEVAGVRFLRRELSQVEDSYDLIMLHHSFEHMPDPDAVLAGLKCLLAPKGTLLLRIPLAASHAWRHYGADWVQLDPPRHLFLHTDRSLETLASRNGFRIVDRFRDSTAFQFWGSEQYRAGIPLRSATSYAENRSASAFPPAAIRDFERQAADLNRQGNGDQGVYYLRLD